MMHTKKRLVALLIALCMVCSCLSVFAIRKPGIFKKGDESTRYICSFDISIDKTFQDYPIYQYADNGILHVTAWTTWQSHGECYFTFGTTKTITTTGAPRTGSSGMGSGGEWHLPPKWWDLVTWDEVVYDDSPPVNGQIIFKNTCHTEPENPPQGKDDLGYLAVDMAIDEGNVSIKMYLYNSNKTSLAGTIKPSSTVASFIPSSFQEISLSEDISRCERGTVFKTNGNWVTAPEGTEASEKLEQDRKDLLAQIIDYKPMDVIVIDHDDPEPPADPRQPTNVKDPTDTKTPEDSKDPDDTKDPNDTKDPSDTKEPERGINLGEHVPKEYRGLTKEESLEKFGGYYDEDGNKHYRTIYNGRVSDQVELVTDKVNRIAFTVPSNMDGISSNGATGFTVYDLEQRQITAKRTREIGTSILEISGNLGTKYYELGGYAWHISAGTTVSSFPGLDDQSAYYGWREIYEITDTYMEHIADQPEAGNIKVHYANPARTAIASLEFTFPGMAVTLPYEEIDYIGSFFTFFMGYGMSEEWAETAKRLGLTAKSSTKEAD